MPNFLKLRAENKKTAKIPTIPNTHEQIARYAEWLTAQAARSSTASIAQEINEYVESAGKTILIGKRKIEIFAPFRPEHSALRTLTGWQVIWLIALLISWQAGLYVFRQGILLVAIAIITAFYTGHLLLTIGLSFSTFRRSSEEHIDEEIISALQDADWPRYTILCPLYREAKVVPQFIRAMQALDYPSEKLQVLLLTEEVDIETRNALRKLCLPAHFKIVTVPDGSPRTKPRACNFGLMQATGQYVVIYDAEDIPDPLQLKKAVLTFANHGPQLACVQAKLNFYNPQQNLLTRMFTAEYSLWFDLILPGLQQLGLAIPLGGTSNHFPTQTLRALGAWDAFNVTEDCDLGLRLARYRLETVVLNSTTYEEANSQLKNWIRQRSRWIKGYMQTYFVNMRAPYRYLHPKRLGEFLSLQLVVGGKTAFLFLNPLLWLLFALYIFVRPQVEPIYAILFPKPLLYISTFSLIFGNFLYIYVYLLACIRRKQYRLMKWALLVPFYWTMMSIAAIVALFQLLLAPHYWEKTEHGLHLRKKSAEPASASLFLEEEPTLLLSVPRIDSPSLPGMNGQSHAKTQHVVAPPVGAKSYISVTASLRIISTLPVPAFSPTEREALHSPERKVAKDIWLVVTVFVACIASLTACWYSFQHQYILLYSDAYAHLRIARRIIDSSSPSLAQFGGVWLPLPHVLMLPFIWNDYLWQTGLAGSIPSMICYLLSTIYLFLAARRLTGDSRASFIGALVFILNPNVLYLQTTPLSELVCFATLTMSCYYFLAWTQEESLKYLIFAAGSTFLATLARYDGWDLFLTLFVLIPVIGVMKHKSRVSIEGNLIVFGLLGGLGIGLWTLWCTVIFGDPLYFQHGPYSSQQQQLVYLQTGSLYTYHDLLQSFRYYTLLSIDTLGPILFLMMVVALIAFVSRHRLTPEVLGTLAFLTPFGFYVVSLYSGQAVLFIPEAVPAYAQQHLYNARFGAEMVAPTALFIALLISRRQLPSLRGFWREAVYIVATIVILTQIVLVASGGILSLQDGQYGLSCEPQHQINIYLAQHYAGGRILQDFYASNFDETDAGIDLKNVVSESSGALWTAALRDPARSVDWIIVRPLDSPYPESPDLVAQNINIASPAFLKQFSFVLQEPTGLQLYHRIGAPLAPTRPIPPALVKEHSLCGAGGS